MSRNNIRFIIADDDPDLRASIRKIILKVCPDAMVGEAATGEEVLELYENGGADLMVIDHKMPLLDGTEIIRTLRENKVSIPLVMVSNLPEAKEEAMAAGATFFLDKSKLIPDLGYFLPAMLPKT
jgi:two-component system nitrate/nitrite response regulator NarL